MLAARHYPKRHLRGIDVDDRTVGVTASHSTILYNIFNGIISTTSPDEELRKKCLFAENIGVYLTYTELS